MKKEHFYKQMRWVKDIHSIHFNLEHSILTPKKEVDKLKKILHEMCESYGEGEY